MNCQIHFLNLKVSTCACVMCSRGTNELTIQSARRSHSFPYILLPHGKFVFIWLPWWCIVLCPRTVRAHAQTHNINVCAFMLLVFYLWQRGWSIEKKITCLDGVALFIGLPGSIRTITPRACTRRKAIIFVCCRLSLAQKSPDLDI